MQNKIQDHYVLFRDDFSNHETIFTNPNDIITAQTPEDFLQAFQKIEEAKKKGKWLAGFVSYEGGFLLEKKLKKLLPEKRNVPLLHFGVFEKPIEQYRQIYANKTDTISKIFDTKPHWSMQEYKERFNIVLDHLKKGNCYQACLTFPCYSRWQGDPKVIFNTLSLNQPVQYGAIISLEDPIILSRSPELFFKVDKNKHIVSSPMKGTAKRGKSIEEDEEIKKNLANDPKNQAENRMIVDLVRNDIARITKIGSLGVKNFLKIETYRTLHQMISSVYGELLPGYSLEQIFSALFPAGSITGAPKIRSMEILRELEPFPRDVYCGAIGWISPHGDMLFNVAIRTISLFDNGKAINNIGSAVVFDSLAENEYKECLLKTQFLHQTNPTQPIFD